MVGAGGPMGAQSRHERRGIAVDDDGIDELVAAISRDVCLAEAAALHGERVVAKA